MTKKLDKTVTTSLRISLPSLGLLAEYFNSTKGLALDNRNALINTAVETLVELILNSTQLKLPINPEEAFKLLQTNGIIIPTKSRSYKQAKQLAEDFDSDLLDSLFSSESPEEDEDEEIMNLLNPNNNPT